MKKFFALAIAVVMAMSLVACSSSTSSSSETAGSNQSSQPETVTIKSLNANGEEVDLVVPYNPQRIAILDMASLDILDALGVGDRVVGSANTSLDYLQSYVTNAEVTNLGTIKEADMEAVMACEPDIIFIGGRLSKSYDALSEIAPVVYLATDSKAGVVESVKKNANTVASMFGLEDKVDGLMADFDGRIQKLADFAKKFSKLNPETQKFIVRMALTVAAVGPVIKIIGTLTTGIGSLAGRMVTLYGKFSQAESISAFLGPGGKIALVLAAIAVAAVLVYKNWDKITAGARKMQKAVVKAINDAGVDTQKLGKTVRQIGTMAASSFGKIGRAGAAVVKFLRPVATFVAGAFKLVFGATFKFIVARASGWLKSTLDIIHGVTTAFSGIITFLEGVFTGNWKKAWTGVKTIFKGAFEALVGFAKRPLNQVIGLVNSVISGLNGIKIPSWVPKLGGKGINLPKIPMLARGTDNWSGGIAQVHEKGGEIIDLPRGTRVYPHDKSVQMARNQGNKTYKIEKFADTIIVREEADIDKIAEKLAEKLEAIPA